MEANSSHDSHLHKDNTGSSFVKKLEDEVEANLTNEQFGVEELAEKVGMSRSNLHRKLQQYTGQSVSQFIREYRLRRGLDYLENENLTVSEVAFRVGFSSASYFTTCFTEYFGYAPSGVKYKLTKDQEFDVSPENQKKVPQSNLTKYAIAGSLLVVVLLLVYFVFRPFADDSPVKPIGETLTHKSIAILPFENLSANEENEYFVEGVTGAITINLSGISDISVISRISTNKYKNSNLSAKEIANELQVSHLLEGSIQRYQNIVRVDVRLIDAHYGNQVWAESYDREFEDILNIQSELAEKVVLTLKSKLTPEDKTVIHQRVTENTDAYDLYLKGIFHYRTYTTSGNHEAIKYFMQAIALDSGFASAYAGLAATHIARASIFGAELKPSEAFSIAKPLLDKALELDPKQTEALTWTGFYYLYNDWDFERAEKKYKNAIVSDHPDALAVYADYLNFVKRHEEALTISKRLNRLHPHYPNSRMILSLYYLGKYDEAEDFAIDRLKVFSNYYSYDSYGFLMLNTGNYQKAVSLFQKAMDVEGIRYPRMLGWMGAAYAKSGQKEKAIELIDEMKVRYTENSSGSVAFFIAVIYTALEDQPSALKWLQTSYESHEMEIPWLISEPQFYPLHDEPAFRKMVKKVGFPNTEF